MFRNETHFNAYLRGVLRGQGLQCLHIRETDADGVADLLVWAGTVMLAWAELKVADEPLRPAQKGFLRDTQDREGGAYVIKLLTRDSPRCIILRGAKTWDGDLYRLADVPEPMAFNWRWFFESNRGK